jgi:DNA-directed RNA polymerase subunit L
MTALVTMEHAEDYFTLETTGFNTATVNGIRRTMLLDVPCLGFREEINPEDLALLTGLSEKRHTVLVDTLASQSIPILAHRCSRIPIHTSDETATLLESTPERKVFFVVCERFNPDEVKDLSFITRPFILEELTKTIYSRELEPVVLHGSEHSGNMVYMYNKTDSDNIRDQLKTIFPYNVIVAVVKHHEKLNIVLSPVSGTGRDNVRWTPCTFRYTYQMDPKWISDRDKGVIHNGSVTRKINGEKPLKYLFTHDPETDKAYTKFGKPYGHKMMFQYNGKMDHVEAFHKSIKRMKTSLDFFREKYLESDQDDPVMLKTEPAVVADTAGMESNVEILTIPKNVQEQHSSEVTILTDHTMGNLLTSKMLEIVDELIIKNPTDDAVLWNRTHIAYKVPHPLVKQSVIMIKLPYEIITKNGVEDSDLYINHKNLIVRTIVEIKADLDALDTAITLE